MRKMLLASIALGLCLLTTAGLAGDRGSVKFEMLHVGVGYSGWAIANWTGNGNMEVQVHIEGALPDETYWGWASFGFFGPHYPTTVSTNKKGIGNCHIKGVYDPPYYPGDEFHILVNLWGPGGDRYSGKGYLPHP